MGEEILFVTIVPVSAMAMILGIVYLAKKENLAMIEKGLNPKIYKPAPYTTLKYGLLITGCGLGLLIAYLIDMASLTIDAEENATLYFALLAVFGGIGLILSYSIEKKEWLDKGGE